MALLGATLSLTGRVGAVSVCEFFNPILSVPREGRAGFRSEDGTGRSGPRPVLALGDTVEAELGSFSKLRPEVNDGGFLGIGGGPFCSSGEITLPSVVCEALEFWLSETPTAVCVTVCFPCRLGAGGAGGVVFFPDAGREVESPFLRGGNGGG